MCTDSYKKRSYRPLPSSKNPRFQNEAMCTTVLEKMSVTCMRMKNLFQINGSGELGNGLVRTTNLELLLLKCHKNRPCHGFRRHLEE